MFPTGGTNLAGTATMQRFNSSGVWQPPFGVTTIYLIAVGGGQGGGGARATGGSATACGGGGGGGQVISGWYNVSSPLSIVVGGGGAGGSIPGTDPGVTYGTNGGNTTITGSGISVTALGGGTNGCGPGGGVTATVDPSQGGGGGGSGVDTGFTITATNQIFYSNTVQYYKLNPGLVGVSAVSSFYLAFQFYAQGRKGVNGFGGGGNGAQVINGSTSPLISVDGGGLGGFRDGSGVVYGVSAGSAGAPNTGGGGGGTAVYNNGTGAAGGAGADGTVCIIWWA